jgi:hypothetical protein
MDYPFLLVNFLLSEKCLIEPLGFVDIPKGFAPRYTGNPGAISLKIVSLRVLSLREQPGFQYELTISYEKRRTGIFGGGWCVFCGIAYPSGIYPAKKITGSGLLQWPGL